MASKLEELKEKKAALLKKAGLKDTNIDLLRQRAAEEKKIKAEIFALEHPGSLRTRDTLKSAGKSFGGFIKRNSANFARNAERMGKEMREESKKKRAEERKVEIARYKAVKRVRGGKRKVTKETRKSKPVDYSF